VVESIYKLEETQTQESREVKNYSKEMKIEKRKKFRNGIRTDEVIHY